MNPFVKRLVSITFAGALTMGAGVSLAQAGVPRPIHQDRHEVRLDHREVRGDRHELRHDITHGTTVRDFRRDRADLRRDRRDTRQDHRDLRHDIYRLKH